MKKCNHISKTFSISLLTSLTLVACNSGNGTTNSNSPASNTSTGILSSQTTSTSSQTPILANDKTSIDLTYNNQSQFEFHCSALKDTSTKTTTGSNSFSQDIGRSVVDYLVFTTNFSTDSYGALSCSNITDSSNPWGFTISSPAPQINTITLADNTREGNTTQVNCTDPKTGNYISQYLTSAQKSVNCRAGTYVYNDGRANPTDGVTINFSSTIKSSTPTPEIISNPPVIANDKTNIAIGIANNVSNGEVFTCKASATTAEVNGGSSTQSWKLISSGVYPDVSYYQDFNPDVYGVLNCNNSDSINKWSLKINKDKAQNVTIAIDTNNSANYQTQVSCLSGNGSKISQTLTPTNSSISCRAQNWLYTTSVDPVGQIRADKVAINISPIGKVESSTPTPTVTPTPTPTISPTEFSMPNPIPNGVTIASLSDIYSNAMLGFDNNTNDSFKCVTPTKQSKVNGTWVSTPGLNLSIKENPLYTAYSISNQGYMNCANSNNSWGLTIDTNGGRSNVVSLNSNSKAAYTTSVTCISQATNLSITKILTPGNEVNCRAAKYMYSDGIERADPIAITINK